jgi:hypothetical protein
VAKSTLRELISTLTVSIPAESLYRNTGSIPLLPLEKRNNLLAIATVQSIRIRLCHQKNRSTEKIVLPILTGLAFLPESVLLLLKAGLLTPFCETPSRFWQWH